MVWVVECFLAQRALALSKIQDYEGVHANEKVSNQFGTDALTEHTGRNVSVG